MTNSKTQLTVKQKRMLLAIPIVMLPFVAFLFWSLGGGKQDANAQVIQQPGLNMQLPDANLKNDSTQNKLSFYQQAEKDSAKFLEQRKDDPYYKQPLTGNDSSQQPTLQDLTTGGSYSPVNNSVNAYQPFRSSLSGKEEQITQKLQELNRKMIENDSQAKAINAGAVNAGNREESTDHPPTGITDDPELKQLSGMLDQIMDIQNPARAAQKLKEQSLKGRGQVFAMTTQPNDNSAVQVMGSSTEQSGNYFYDLNTGSSTDDPAQPSVPATVYQTQTLTSGTTIRLRLSADIFINGSQIPEGTFVNGICAVEGDRLNITIKTIRYKNSLLPVALSVYDMDGIAGINVPGAITRDAAKEGADQVMQNLDFYSMNSSIGAQATSAGLQAAKGLFGRKVKLVKVTVRAGYPVLLMDDNKRDQ